MAYKSLPSISVPKSNTQPNFGNNVMTYLRDYEQKPMVPTTPQIPSVTTVSKNTPSIIAQKTGSSLPAISPPAPNTTPSQTTVYDQSGNAYYRDYSKPDSKYGTSYTDTYMGGSGSGSTTNLPSIKPPSTSSDSSSGSTSGGTSGGGSNVSGNLAPTGYGPNGNMTQAQFDEYQRQLAEQAAKQAAQQKAQTVNYQNQFTFNPAQNQNFQAMQQMNQELYQSNVAMAQQLNAEYQAALSGARAQIEKMFQDQIGGVDPATQQALTQLEKQVQDSQKQVVDFLNERGIAHSGIAVEELGKLTGQANDRRSQMAAARVKDLQNQMINSLMSFAQQQLSGLSQNNSNQMNAFNQYAQNQQGALQNSMNQSYQEYMTGIENQQKQEAATTAYNRGVEQDKLDYQQQQELAAQNYAKQMELEKYQQGQQNYRANLNNQAPQPTQTQNSNYWISSALNEMNKQPTLQQKNDWLYNHQAEIIKNAGTTAYQYLLEQLYPKY